MLIGTSTYTGMPGTATLPGVRNNISDLINVLADPVNGGFSRDNCISLIDEPDPEVILQKLDEAAEQAQDVLLVYLAAHATPKDNVSNELAILLSGTDTTKRRWWRDALSYNDTRQVLRESRARNTIVIVDTCFAGRVLPEVLGTDLFDVGGAYTLAAVGPNGRASAKHWSRQNTAFTGVLLQFLSEGVAGPDPLLSLPRIYPLLRAELTAHEYPVPHQHQTNEIEQIAIVRNRSQVTDWTVPKEIAEGLNSLIPTVRREAVAALGALGRGVGGVARDQVRTILTGMVADDSNLVRDEVRHVLDAVENGVARPAHPVWPRVPEVDLDPRIWPERTRSRPARCWLPVGVVAWVAAALFLWWRDWIIWQAAIAGLAIGVLGWLAAFAGARLAEPAAGPTQGEEE
ncbi:hypothetical protein BLA60_33075 [Actinophytocola xinjiangensis]|uniref:Caspase domain-containing protein n=1 Tax=Actinophytocola xinjiangensis TaxID=485602 RepID=A0A7Z1AW70_9PSEU|nr:hypothetical protein BLA60_33075 [Actinophytocola xinjiangensis]